MPSMRTIVTVAVISAVTYLGIEHLKSRGKGGTALGRLRTAA